LTENLICIQTITCCT